MPTRRNIMPGGLLMSGWRASTGMKMWVGARSEDRDRSPAEAGWDLELL